MNWRGDGLNRGKQKRPARKADLFLIPTFADKSPRQLHYFFGAIASFAAFATRNFTTVFALMAMGSPVCGLRPMRALRCAFTSRPRPGITNTPFFFVSLI